MKETINIYVPVLLIDNHQCTYSIAEQNFVKVNRLETLGMAVGFSGLVCACQTMEEALSYAKSHFIDIRKDIIHNRYYKSEISIRIYKFLIYVDMDNGLINTYREGYYPFAVSIPPLTLEVFDQNVEFVPVTAGDLINENE